MAIIRCPYCHAIIDENDKYCNNCGTQLLFPEDESVEEEIPGEKIIDVEEEEEEKDYSLDEPEKEASRKPAPEEETKVYPLRPVEKEESEEGTVETIPSPPSEEQSEASEGGTGTVEEKEEKPDTEKVRTGEIDNGEAEEAGPSPMPVTFDTLELESIGKTIELSKERIDKMIEVMAGKQKEESPEEAPEPEPGKKTGTLPPWADKIKGAASIVEREETRDVGRRFGKETWAGPAEERPAEESRPGGTGEKPREPEEEEIFPHRKASDSGIGLPERVTQAALPFEPSAGEEDEGEEDEQEALGPAERTAEAGLPKSMEAGPLRREETIAEAGFEKETEPEEETPRPPFQFSVFFKAKAFDFLFIGIFWLVALWVAARSMDATLFELLSVTSGSVLLLYAVFLVLYFFLFKFFLGETLGDRLFKERE